MRGMIDISIVISCGNARWGGWTLDVRLVRPCKGSPSAVKGAIAMRRLVT